MIRILAALAALALPTAAHAEWHEASTTHFRVYSDDKPETVRDFATRLERFDKMLRYLRDVPDDALAKANRVTVFVVPDVATVARLAHTSNAAGFYIPRAGDSVAYVPKVGSGDQVPDAFKDMMLSPLQILLHEYTHHFLLSLSPRNAYPTWFTEGYAEFFAASEFEPDGSVIVGRPPQYRANDVWGDNPLPTSRMLTLDRNKLSQDQVFALYARGWLLTHYLFLGGKRDGQLGAYFRALNEGKPAAEAAQVFGDLRQLDKELWQYKRLALPALRVRADVLPIAEVTVRKLGAGESAVMRVRYRSKAGVRRAEAADIYSDAKAASAGFPNDVAAQLALAEAAWDAGDYVGAEAAADRALATNPASVDALVYKARAQLSTAHVAGDKKPATWLVIRKLLSRANAADTENPQPLWLYYRTYLEAGQPVPKMAREGLEYAALLAPQDLYLREELAHAYLREGNVTGARAMLQTLAVDPHGGAQGSFAAKLIALIDGGHPDQAIAEIDKAEAEPAKGDSPKQDRK